MTGVSVGSYEDLEPRGQPVDRDPLLSCEICGESRRWQDYWKDRILSADDPEDAPLWCDGCEEEIETLRRRRSNNAKITEWVGLSSTETDQSGDTQDTDQ